MLLSILFVPFEAAIQHYTRNAKNGVKGYTMEQDVGGNRHRRSRDEEVEEAGTAYEFRPVKKRKIDSDTAKPILKAKLEDIIRHAFQQILRNQQLSYADPDAGSGVDAARTKPLFSKKMARRRVSRYPDVLFLSEQPGELEFPDSISFTSDGHPIVYKLIGTAGKLAVQRIYGYVRQSVGGTWAYASVVKNTKPFNKDENVLVMKCEMFGSSCCFAGVHLSAKNVNASESDRRAIIEQLVSFCAGGAKFADDERSTPIQFVIGDFNIDVHAGFDGHVGVRPGSTVYLAQQSESTMGVQYAEQYSNSTNTAHFMGHLVVDSKVSLRGHSGLSLQRSLDGEYVSDHPPLYVELEFP